MAVAPRGWELHVLQALDDPFLQQRRVSLVEQHGGMGDAEAGRLANSGDAGGAHASRGGAEPQPRPRLSSPKCAAISSVCPTACLRRRFAVKLDTNSRYRVPTPRPLPRHVRACPALRAACFVLTLRQAAARFAVLGRLLSAYHLPRRSPPL